LESPFAAKLSALTEKALFDPEIRAAWRGTKVSHMYGNAASWNVHFAVWNVQRRVKEAKGSAPITFRPIEGANHFVMWEDPSLTLGELIGCMNVRP